MNRAVHTIFCDDIRQEVNGKVSYIGVYADALLASRFPITLPKLCLALKVTTPAEGPFRSLKVRVLRDDEILADVEVGKAALALTRKGSSGMAKSRRGQLAQAVQANLVFSPLRLDGPCTLRVRVDTEEGELEGLGLRVDLMPQRKVPK